MLSKPHSGLGDFVTELARVAHIHVGFDVPSHTLPVSRGLATTSALKGTIQAPLDH